ncbi:MAG: thioesterase family protein [Ruminococcus sp.]|nr:thioesterase family protein [Ruminococcus sp.]
MIRNTYNLSVRGYELDSFGHVNNSVYLQYAETALWDCFNKHGFLDMIRENGLFPVILESSQRYINELRLLDEVQIESEFAMKNGIICYRHTIKDITHDRISCRIKGKLGLVNAERIICDVPDSVKIQLEDKCDESDKK